MSDNLPSRDVIDAIPDDPTDPNEVISAARSCSVILVLIAILVLIVCIGVSISVLN